MSQVVYGFRYVFGAGFALLLWFGICFLGVILYDWVKNRDAV